MSRTEFDALKEDPRLRQATDQILDSLAAARGCLAGVRPPREELAVAYRDAVDEWGRLRGAPLFYPYLGSGLGNGALVELADGSVKYDFIIGIGVHFLGHGHPALARAALEAALESTAMQGNLQQSRISAEFGRLLLDAANRKRRVLDHCFLTTSGAMANENACKLIFQRKQPANRLLAFAGGFAGRTLALSQVSDKPAYRVGLPDTIAVDYLPFYEADRPAASTAESLAVLRELLDRYPGRHAGMIFELVRGEGGFYPGDGDFFRAIMGELRARGVAVLVDEIQTFGRTPEIFAYQYFGLDEFVDVVTIGKLTQVCATLFRDEYSPQAGLISQTFTGSTAGLYVGTAVLRELLGGDYYGPAGRIQRQHDHFVRRLTEIGERTGQVRGPFGLGAMVAATLLDGDAERTRAFVKRLFEAGVITFTAGSQPTRVRFLLPAGGLDEDAIDAATGIIETTLKEFL